MRSLVILAVLLIATTAHSVPVDPDHPSGIVAVMASTIMCQDGSVWAISATPPVWNQLPIDPVPVPLEDIREWNVAEFITHSGTYWWWYENAWHSAAIDPPCQANVGSDAESLGNIKSLFR